MLKFDPIPAHLLQEALQDQNAEPAYDLFIPGHVMNIPHKKLSMNAKALYGTIRSLVKRSGYCWGGNPYLAKIHGCNERTVQKWVEKMKNLGIIKVEHYMDGSTYHRRIWLTEAIKIKSSYAPKGGGGYAPTGVGGTPHGAPILVNEDPHIEDKYKRGRKAPSSSPEAAELCEFFLKSIKKRNPDNRSSITPTWLKDMESLLKERDAQDIQNIITWTEDQRYYNYAILSPRSLRAKFDEMKAKIRGKEKESRMDESRQYALAAKAKYPEKLKHMVFNDTFVRNVITGQSVNFDLPLESFKEAFVSLFRGDT